MVITFIRLLLIFLATVFGACTSDQSGSIRDGYNSTLPLANMRTVVRGNHPASVDAASIWLRKVGLRVIDSRRQQQGFDIPQMNRPDLHKNETQLLYAAKHAEADYLVIVDTIITPTMVLQRIDRKPYQEGNVTETVTIHTLTVSVRGINVETNTVDWSGLANYPEVISDIDQKLRTLTWDALGVAWGVQSPYTPGELRDLKHYQFMNPAIDIHTFPQGIQ